MENLRGAEWIIILVIVGVAWTVLVRLAKARDAKRAGKSVQLRAPTAKLWWGAGLMIYGLLIPREPAVVVIAVIVGIVLLGLGFQDRRQWHESRRLTAPATETESGVEDPSP